MRTRIACVLSVVFVVAAAPGLRVVCDVECAEPQRAALPDGHCTSHDGVPPAAPQDGCDHDHSGTTATPAPRFHTVTVTHADLAGSRAQAVPVVLLITADAITSAAETPLPLPQTPLRI